MEPDPSERLVIGLAVALTGVSLALILWTFAEDIAALKRATAPRLVVVNRRREKAPDADAGGFQYAWDAD